MLKIFDLLPGWVWALLLGLALGLVAVGRIQVAGARQDLATYREEVAENTRKAEAAARARERAMQRQAERIADEQAQRQVVLAAHVADAIAAADGLRNEITRLNSRPAPTDPRAAAFAREARTARELLGTCAAEYRAVAEEVDRRGAQITGLQDFIGTVYRAPP